MYRNPYAVLLGILPPRPLLVGVVTYSANGVAEVALPGGGYERARGEATVGQRVFIRDGAIEGNAPDLTDVIYDI